MLKQFGFMLMPFDQDEVIVRHDGVIRGHLCPSEGAYVVPGGLDSKLADPKETPGRPRGDPGES